MQAYYLLTLSGQMKAKHSQISNPPPSRAKPVLPSAIRKDSGTNPNFAQFNFPSAKFVGIRPINGINLLGCWI